MTNLQDELAGLNHRLGHKLDSWRRLHELYRSIACCLWITAFPLILWSFCISQGLKAILVAFGAIPAVYFCIFRIQIYNDLLDEGQGLKNELYSSFLNNNKKSEDMKNYHDKFGELMKKERNFLQGWGLSELLNKTSNFYMGLRNRKSARRGAATQPREETSSNRNRANRFCSDLWNKLSAMVRAAITPKKESTPNKNRTKRFFMAEQHRISAKKRAAIQLKKD